MYCSRCGTNNVKTSKFCRECGKRLDLGIPKGEPEEATEGLPPDATKVQELLFQAFQNYESDNLDETVKLCYEALRLDSLSTSGHSLLAMALEKKGDVVGAIRHYERVLAINPKSAADREKLDELRARATPEVKKTTLDQHVRGYYEIIAEFMANTRPWPATIGATLLAFLILFVIWPKPSSRLPAQPAPPAGSSSAQPYPGAVTAAPPLPNSGGTPLFIGSERSSTPAPMAESVSPPANTGVRTQTARVNYNIPPLPNISIVPRQQVETPRAANPPPVAPSPQDTGSITIRRSTPETPPADPIDNARRLQMSERYDEAIAAWKQVVAGGKRVGEAQQHIATCYQRLGRNKEAIQSFQDAIRAYQQQISSGSNVDEAQRGIRSSELGIKVSQREGG
jgi:tetratricopeptide (TPR) repeat protein